jgi:hypothetical protein
VDLGKRIDLEEKVMKRLMGMLVALLAIIGMGAATTTQTIYSSTAGTTSWNEQLLAGHTIEAESIANVGTSDLLKTLIANPASGVNANGDSWSGTSLSVNKNILVTGTSTYGEAAFTGGLNWQDTARPSSSGTWVIASPNPIGTGYMTEQLTNTGAMSVAKTLTSNGDYDLDASKTVVSNGAFGFDMSSGIWTNTNNPVAKDLSQQQLDVTFKVPAISMNSFYTQTVTDGKAPQQVLLGNIPASTTVDFTHTFGSTLDNANLLENVHFNPQL